MELMILPESGRKPFLSLIDGAKENILMASWKLQKTKLPQKDLLAALKGAVQRGVKVHLVAEGRLTQMEVKSGVHQLGDARKAYTDCGVKVYSVKQYTQSHTKYMVVDGKRAFVGTTNFDKDELSRDFGVVISDLKVINELTQTFWHDINPGLHSVGGTQRRLLWGPEGQREQLMKVIADAKKSIQIYQQDITDPGILGGLLSAIKKNVLVELIMSPHPFGENKPDNNKGHQLKLALAGGKVYLMSKPHVHAKVMIVDACKMYLGSTNSYKPAIEGNRNVGLLTNDKGLIGGVLRVFAKDKKTANVLQKIE